MRSYCRHTEGDRHQVYALHKAGLRQYAIAEQIGVHKSPICQELHRNKGLRGYRPKQAHWLACSRHAQISCNLILDENWTVIEKMIREDWSPKQINSHLNYIDERGVSTE